MTYTIFVLMNATAAWLRLSREERRATAASEFAPLMEKYPTVRLRFFDAEAFSAVCSDIALFETDDLKAYYFLMEGLRDSKIYSVPYFDVVHIIPAVEQGFEQYETETGA